jgi:hypothetical protein
MVARPLVIRQIVTAIVVLLASIHIGSMVALCEGLPIAPDELLAFTRGFDLSGPPPDCTERVATVKCNPFLTYTCVIWNDDPTNCVGEVCNGCSGGGNQNMCASCSQLLQSKNARNCKKKTVWGGCGDLPTGTTYTCRWTLLPYFIGICYCPDPQYQQVFCEQRNDTSDSCTRRGCFGP